MEIVRVVLLAIIGLGSGMVISGAVFAFITAIGVVPRLAQKTRTTSYLRLYESSIVAGGIFGALAGIFNMKVPIGSLWVVIIALCVGVFYGVLAMSLAEVLNVMPILTRRISIQRGMFYFVLAIALGKMLGAILYSTVPGFFTPGG